MYRTTLLATLLVGICATPAGAGITATQATADLDALARQMLGSGVTLSSGSAVKNAANLSAFGSYTGATGLDAGFDRGVVLSSGTFGIVRDPASPSYFATNDQNNGEQGDPDLVWSFPGRPDQDPTGAATLSFDVVPVGPVLRIPFVFGSEEYESDPVNRYEDRMAVLVGGAQCAKVGGQLPSVFSFDEHNPVAANAGFVDNHPAGADVPGFAGFSRPGALACEASVTPGQPVRVKLAVSDVEDHMKNTGLLVAASGITSEPVPPPDPPPAPVNPAAPSTPAPAAVTPPLATTVPPAPPAAFTTTVASRPEQATYARARRGVAVEVVVSARSRVDVALTVPKKVGDRLGTRTIAKARKTATRAGKVTVGLRISAKIARRLRAFRTVKARFVITVTPATGRPVKRTVAVTLRRT